MLVDICRQSIVFEDAAGVAACLAAVRADKEVLVLRVKNRLDPNYDATVSAGYRDVAINLRIISTATEKLGIDMHVCEVQLLLLPFALLKVQSTCKKNRHRISICILFCPQSKFGILALMQIMMRGCTIAS
jgi:hypothetical protein